MRSRRPTLRELRREFPEWDITGTRREGFMARRADVTLPAAKPEALAEYPKQQDPDPKENG